MARIVDLTLPVVTGMAGIPRIPLYEQYPVKVQAGLSMAISAHDSRGKASTSSRMRPLSVTWIRC